MTSGENWCLNDLPFTAFNHEPFFFFFLGGGVGLDGSLRYTKVPSLTCFHLFSFPYVEVYRIVKGCPYNERDKEE